MKSIISPKKFILLVVLLLVTLSLQTALAQDTTTPPAQPLTVAAPPSMERIFVAVETDNPPAPVPAPALGRNLDAVKTANIQVNYINAATTWDTQPAAKAAFQYAVDIWSTLINSSTTIVVDAYWEDLNSISPYVLGAAGATTIHANNGSFPYANTWYSSALANALAGYDINSGTAEIRARFNSGFANWYFGTDTNTPFDKYNFASVVLHEIGHGLGFFGSMSYDNGIGDVECRGISGEGCWGYSGGGGVYPVIYDRFTENVSGTALINTSIYPNPSVQLGLQLTSNNIYFDGANATSANGGRVPLYAPAIWSGGSSYSHLAESFNGTENALMTYSLTNGETNYHPGPVALAMFKDMGWNLAGPTYEPPTLEPLPPQLLAMNTEAINTIDLQAYTVVVPGIVYDLQYDLIDAGDVNAGISFDGRYINISPQTDWTGKTTATIEVSDLSGDPNETSSSSFTVTVTDTIYKTYLPTVIK